jgi:hypothetical protein
MNFLRIFDVVTRERGSSRCEAKPIHYFMWLSPALPA